MVEKFFCGKTETEIVFGMSTRADGDMQGVFQQAMENRARFLAKNGLPAYRVVYMIPQHKDHIELIEEGRYFVPSFAVADALITKERVTLAFAPADCLPIFIWNKEAVGLVHAGRKGTLLSITHKAVRKFLEITSSRPIYARFGPHIRPCCYRFPKEIWEEVGEELLLLNGKFPGCVNFSETGDLQVDLAWANKKSLASFWIEIDYPPSSLECTCCTKKGREYKYFSHRRDGQGRNLVFIAKK